MPRSPPPGRSVPPPVPLSPTIATSLPESYSAHPGPVRPALVDHVGQRLGDGEVDGRLHRRGCRPASSICRSTGSGRLSVSARTAPSRPRSASTGGWMPRTRVRSSVRACPLDARASASRFRARSGFSRQHLLGEPNVHAQRDQPGLRPVVQVALDPAQLGRGGVHRLGAGLGQLAYLGGHRLPGRGQQRCGGPAMGLQQQRPDEGHQVPACPGRAPAPRNLAARCSTSRTATRQRSATTTHTPATTMNAGSSPRTMLTGTPTSAHSRSRQVAGSVSSHRHRCSRPISPLVSSTGRGRYGVAIVTPDQCRAQLALGAGQPPQGQQAHRREAGSRCRRRG